MPSKKRIYLSLVTVAIILIAAIALADFIVIQRPCIRAKRVLALLANTDKNNEVIDLERLQAACGRNLDSFHCTGKECALTCRFDNFLRRKLERPPLAMLFINVDTSGGRIESAHIVYRLDYGTEMLRLVVDREDSDRIPPDIGGGYPVFLPGYEYEGQIFGRHWWPGGRRVTNASTPEERHQAYNINLECLRSLRGCTPNQFAKSLEHWRE